MHGLGFGAYDGATVTQKSLVVNAEDAQNSSDTRRLYDTDDIIHMLSFTAISDVAVGRLQNITSTSFDINFTTANSTAAVFIYMCWGGSDITDAKAISFPVNTATGNQDITTVGFQGDFALFGWSNTAIDADASASHAYYAWGFAKSSTQRGAIAMVLEDNRNPPDNWRWQKTDRCLLKMNASSGAIEAEVDFVSWLSNGFRINVVDGPGAADIAIALVIKGGFWDCGALTSPTAGTLPVSQDITTTINPTGIILAGHGRPGGEGVVSDSTLSIGGANATNSRASVWAGHTDNVTPSVTAGRHLTDKVFSRCTATATATSTTTEAEADLGSFGTAKFTLSWSIIDALNAYQVLWIACAPSTTNQNIERVLDTETVAVSETLGRVVNKTRAISQTVNVSESIARQNTKNRALATETVVVSEQVVRVKGKVETVPTETVDVSESAAISQRQKSRAVIENVSVSEDAVRQKSANRNLATETVAVSESAIFQRGKSRALGTEIVNVSEEIARQTNKTRARTENVSVSESAAISQRTKSRSISENVSVGENVTRQKSVFRTLTAEIVSVGETLARMVAKTRSRSESVTVSETVDRESSAEGPKNITRSITENVDVTESVTRQKSISRALTTQIVAVGETLTRLAGKNRARTENVTVNESLSLPQRTKNRAITENVPVTEQATRQTSKFKALALESVSVAENIARQLAKNRAISQAVTVAETLQQETVTEAKHVTRALATEVVAVSENIARHAQKTRALATQTVIVEDIITAFKNGVELVKEIKPDLTGVKKGLIERPHNRRLKSNLGAFFLGRGR